MISHSICPVCHSKSILYVEKMYDDRYGYPAIYDLYQCSKCQHKHLSTTLEDKLLDQLYTNYYPRSTFSLEDFKVLSKNQGFFSWLNGDNANAHYWVPSHVTVLDIGCGFGESLVYHQQRGCHAYGIEVDRNLLRVAEEFNLNVKIELFSSSLYEQNFFDYVTLHQVIEHSNDPIAMLKEIALVLKPQGKVILTTPNSNGWGAMIFDRYWINWHIPYHIQNFTHSSIKIAAEKAGLELEYIKTITSSEWLYYQWLHLLFYPRYGEISSFWKPDKTVFLWQRIIKYLVKLAHKTKINHLVTKLFDLLFLGDNFVIILRKNNA
jgi:2-polyprenyl-3-methyl-5-hydroxy-6-metoxy-1,4-benzoquinol methylase